MRLRKQNWTRDLSRKSLEKSPSSLRVWSMSIQNCTLCLRRTPYAVVMVISIGLVLLGIGLITVRSPSKQSEGDNGRLHPKRSDIFFNDPLAEGLYWGGRAKWHDSNCLRCLMYMMSKCLCLWLPFYVFHVRWGEFCGWFFTLLAVGPATHPSIHFL